ncbi:MAG: hypothetical protein AB1480_10280 [Nitrospirota bacterium]
MNEKLQRYFVYPIAEWYLKENVLTLSESLRTYDYIEKDDAEKYALDRIQKLIKHAYRTTAYYRAFFDSYGIDPLDITTLKDFESIPVLTKDRLREQFPDLISSVKFPKVSKIHSGGTMGQSIYVLRDNYSLSFDRAVKGKCISWYGCSIGDREFRMWSYPFGRMDNFKAYCIDLLLNRRRVSPLKMTAGRAVRIAKAIHSFKPKLIYGWTTGLYKFAQIAEEAGISFEPSDLRVVISTAERLYDYQRSLMRKVYQRPIVDEYGCSEAGVIGFECEAGNKHIQVENNYLEVVNKENYADGLGELVVTNLTNYAMPLIRYRIGDIGSINYGPCDCGRLTPFVSHVSGRILDYLIDSSGEVVLGEVFCYICFDLIDKYGAIKDFRVRQERDGSINIYYVPSTKYYQGFLGVFEDAIRKHLGKGLIILFHEMADLTIMDKGKPRYVVSNDERKDDSH